MTAQNHADIILCRADEIKRAASTSMPRVACGRDCRRDAPAGRGCHTTPLLVLIDSAITLAINPVVVPLNGTAEIIATVIEQGGTAVQNGTLVIFTTTLGTIDPREARTSNASSSPA